MIASGKKQGDPVLPEDALQTIIRIKHVNTAKDPRSFPTYYTLHVHVLPQVNKCSFSFFIILNFIFSNIIGVKFTTLCFFKEPFEFKAFIAVVRLVF